MRTTITRMRPSTFACHRSLSTPLLSSTASSYTRPIIARSFADDASSPVTNTANTDASSSPSAPGERRDGRPWTARTLARRELASTGGARLGDSRGNARSGSWRLTSSQYRATRQPYTSAIASPPVAERVHSPAHVMRSLKYEYAKELATKYPKKPFDQFEAGDKIELVKKMALTVNKVQTFRGTVLDKRGGANPSFILRTMKLEVPIELQMPIYSPFIVSIRLLAKGHYRRAKLYYLRDRPYKEWVAE